MKTKIVIDEKSPWKNFFGNESRLPSGPKIVKLKSGKNSDTCCDPRRKKFGPCS